jgi:hypothetical protein
MKVYLCLDDHGRYPTLIVVVSDNVTHAQAQLMDYLRAHEWENTFTYFKVSEVSTQEARTFELEMESY